jgi:hypothetical protein
MVHVPFGCVLRLYTKEGSEDRKYANYHYDYLHSFYYEPSTFHDETTTFYARDYGDVASCPRGYGVSQFCGSGRNKDCNGNVGWIRCGTAFTVDGTRVTLTRGDPRDLTECPEGHAIVGICFSGADSDCLHYGNSYRSILYCDPVEGGLDSSSRSQLCAKDRHESNDFVSTVAESGRLLTGFCNGGSEQDCTQCGGEQHIAGITLRKNVGKSVATQGNVSSELDEALANLDWIHKMGAPLTAHNHSDTGIAGIALRENVGNSVAKREDYDWYSYLQTLQVIEALTIRKAHDHGDTVMCPKGWGVREYCGAGKDPKDCNGAYGWIKCTTSFLPDVSLPRQIVERTNVKETTPCPEGYAIVGICFSGKNSDCPHKGRWFRSLLHCEAVKGGLVSDGRPLCPADQNKERDFVSDSFYSIFNHGNRDTRSEYLLTAYCNAGENQDCECFKDGINHNQHNAGVLRKAASFDSLEWIKTRSSLVAGGACTDARFPYQSKSKPTICYNTPEYAYGYLHPGCSSWCCLGTNGDFCAAEAEAAHPPCNFNVCDSTKGCGIEFEGFAVFGYDPTRDDRVMVSDHHALTSGDYQNSCRGHLYNPGFYSHVQVFRAPAQSIKVLRGATALVYSSAAFMGHQRRYTAGRYLAPTADVSYSMEVVAQGQSASGYQVSVTGAAKRR